MSTTQSRVRRGKLRKHEEGYLIHIFRSDDTLLATVYGGDPTETEVRALIVKGAFEGKFRPVTERKG